VFWDPDADEAFVESLRRGLRPDIAINTFEHHVNDPRFGEIVADLFVDLLERAGVSTTQLERAT
jgi:uncharacterized protein (UPF0261 family)